MLELPYGRSNGAIIANLQYSRDIRNVCFSFKGHRTFIYSAIDNILPLIMHLSVRRVCVNAKYFL